MGIERSRLGCSEKCLKGGLEEKLEVLEKRSLWLELEREMDETYQKLKGKVEKKE